MPTPFARPPDRPHRPGPAAPASPSTAPARRRTPRCRGQGRAASRPGDQAALSSRDGRISTSAEIPRRSCRRRIISVDSPRLPVQHLRDTGPCSDEGSRSFRVRPCCSMRNLIASIGSAGPWDTAPPRRHRSVLPGYPADHPWGSARPGARPRRVLLRGPPRSGWASLFSSSTSITSIRS